MKWRNIQIGMIFTLLTACSPSPPRPLEPPRLTSTSFDPVHILVGDELEWSLSGGVGYADILLRSFIDKQTGIRRHQVYLSITYTSDRWRFYSYATNEVGVAADVTKISQRVDSCGPYGLCTYNETVAVSLSEATLRTAAPSGFRFQLRANSGDRQIFTVPPEQIRLQIQGLDRMAPSPSPVAPVLGSPRTPR